MFEEEEEDDLAFLQRLTRYTVEGPFSERPNPSHAAYARELKELDSEMRELEFLLRTRYHLFSESETRKDALLLPESYRPTVTDLALYGIPSGRVQESLPESIRESFQRGWRKLFADVIERFVEDKREAFLERYGEYHPLENAEEAIEARARISKLVFGVYERVLLDGALLDDERQWIENEDFVGSYPFMIEQLRALTRKFLDSYAFKQNDDDDTAALERLVNLLKSNADPRMLEWYGEWREEHRKDYVERTLPENVRQLEEFMRRLALQSKQKVFLEQESVQNMYRDYLEKRLLLERYRSITENARFAALLTRESVENDSIPEEFLVRALPNRYELLEALGFKEDNEELEAAREKIYIFSIAQDAPVVDYATAKQLLFTPVPERTSTLASSDLVVEALASDVKRLARWLDPERWRASLDVARAYYANRMHHDIYDARATSLEKLAERYRQLRQRLAQTQPTVRATFVEVRRTTDHAPIRMCVRVVDTLENSAGVASYTYSWYHGDSGELVRRVTDSISSRDCLELEAEFDAAQAGRYYCIVNVISPEGNASVTRSESAYVIIESFCVRCREWYDEAENVFGACEWHDQPSEEEKRAIRLFHSREPIDQPNYEGLLARFNRAIEQFSLEQRRVDYYQWLRDYPNISLPLQSGGEGYATRPIYEWLSTYTGIDERILDDPRESLEVRQTKCLLRVLEASVEQLDTLSAKRRRLEFGSTQRAIWNEAEGITRVESPRRVLETSIPETLVLSRYAPLYETLSVLLYPPFHKLLGAEDRRFVNALMDRLVDFASDLKIYDAQTRRLPGVILHERNYPALDEALDTLFLNVRVMQMSPREIRYLKRMVDARKPYNSGVSESEMFEDADTRESIKAAARAAALNTGLVRTLEGQEQWRCCAQEVSVRGCWRGKHSSSNTQPTPYQLNETELVRGSYRLHWGYDFADIDAFIRANHEAWMRESILGNASEAAAHFRAAQIGAVVFNYLQTETLRRVPTDSDSKRLLGWNDLMEQGRVERIQRSASLQLAPDGRAFRDAFVALDPNASRQTPEQREAEKRQVQQSLQEVESLLGVLEMASRSETKNNTTAAASSSVGAKRKQSDSQRDPYFATSDAPIDTPPITKTHDTVHDNWFDDSDISWGSLSDS